RAAAEGGARDVRDEVDYLLDPGKTVGYLDLLGEEEVDLGKLSRLMLANDLMSMSDESLSIEQAPPLTSTPSMQAGHRDHIEVQIASS
ncbi:MAG: hypothetical protein SGPRY_004791, partial [Prymnesium sp.]